MKIALFGKMRSGKDTVGAFLIEQMGFTRYAFGDEIGRVIDEYFPEAREGGKPRKHYQEIGQSFRKLNECVWINKVLQRIKYDEFETVEVMKQPFHAVICDGRQKNEEIKMREAGFIIVKVECDEEKRIERIKASGDNFNPEQLNHETELQVDLIEPDVVITNNGTLEELYIQVIKLIEGEVK